MNIMEIIGAFRNGTNPQAYLQSQAQNNPAIARALEMTQGKNPDQIMQVAQNLARERGVDLNSLRQQLGI